MRASSFLWKTAILFFAISAAVGVLMRWQFFAPIDGLNYQYLLHTHSHVVLLGWVFNALLAGVHFMVFKDKATKKHLILYLMFQISVLGMLLSFPIQGYATVSISFSTLHILLSYVWARWAWKNLIALNFATRAFLRWGLIYLVLSTLGPFSLGPIIVSGNAGSQAYYIAIYFYLHFLYNGFFVFSIIGMLFWMLQMKNLKVDNSKVGTILKLMNVQCVAGLALSALWMRPHPVVYVVGAIAGIVQLLAFFRLAQLFRPIWKNLTENISWIGILLLRWCFAGLVLKILLQAVSAVPFIADMAYEVRNYTIGYLHLVFLGVATPFLLAWFHTQGMMPVNSRFKKTGLVFLFAGFVLSELVIVTPSVWDSAYYFKLLFATSVILWVGIIMLLSFKRVESRSIIITHRQ